MHLTLPRGQAERAVAIGDWLKARREQLRQAQARGADAVALTGAFSDDVQAAASQLFSRVIAELPHGPPLALVAQGSLGRRELSPYSDWDLLLVSDTPSHPWVKEAADAFFYPLWDARIEVGHGVRTPSDCRRLVESDTTAMTAALDLVPLAGDAALLSRVGTVTQAALATSAVRRTMERLLGEWLAEDSPATIYRLQPDIKAGPGGLRELQRMWWAARLVWKIRDSRDLLARGWVRPHDFDVLERGRAFLLSLRLAMHVLAGRRQDQLRFDLQDDVASQLGIAPASGLAAGDVLLRDFYQSAKAMRIAGRHVLERCCESLRPHGRPKVVSLAGFDVFNGQLTLHSADQLERAPIEILRLARLSQTSGYPLYLHARERLAEAAPRLLTPEVAQDQKLNRLLYDIIADVKDGGRTLEVLHSLGVLERLIPELRPLLGLVQRDLYHVYTVDAHLIYSARRASELLAGQDGVAPADITELAQRLSRPHLLVLGALFHDIGKGAGHGHAERGAAITATAAARLGLEPEDADDLCFLVREHLAMFRLSQRRDLEDTELIARFAARVESLERLDLLFLLSYVDASTTGPEAWTEWKAALLRQLYRRTRTALREGVAEMSLGARAETRRREIVAVLTAKDPDLVELLGLFTSRHIVAHRPALLLTQLEQLREARHSGAACTVAVDTQRGAWEIVAVGRDRPGLLADLAGSLAAAGISIDAAHIFGTKDGFVVDTFVVGSGPSVAVEQPERRAAMLASLRAALCGHPEYHGRLRERRLAAQSLDPGLPVPKTRVVFDAEAAVDATVLDLFAPDRVGLLHDVARTIFDLGASVALARVGTEGGRAVDAFYVVDAQSGRPLGEEARVQLETAICAVAARAN